MKISVFWDLSKMLPLATFRKKAVIVIAVGKPLP